MILEVLSNLHDSMFLYLLSCGSKSTRDPGLGTLNLGAFILDLQC